LKDAGLNMTEAPVSTRHHGDSDRAGSHIEHDALSLHLESQHRLPLESDRDAKKASVRSKQEDDIGFLSRELLGLLK
jgi:hypothetical protein